MSSNGNDDAFFNFCLIALGVVLGLAGIFYVISFLMPLVLFYVLPFAILSIAVGYVLWLLVQNGEGGFDKVSEYSSEKRYASKYNFKTLAVVYPVLILVAFLIFEVGSVRREVVDKKGMLQGVYLEWPGVNAKYNEVRSNWFGDSIFESLREDAKRPQVYDRSDIGAIVWLALILGAPSFFFYLSRNADQEESRTIAKAIDEKAKLRKEKLQTLIQEQDAILKRRQKPLEDELTKLRARVNEVMSENQVLKAKMEFGRPASTVKADVKANTGRSGGVLDGDLL